MSIAGLVAGVVSLGAELGAEASGSPAGGILVAAPDDRVAPVPTALHDAVADADLQRVEVALADIGVEVDAVDGDGLTPLLLAVSAWNQINQSEVALIVNRLIGTGANVNARSPDGDTPLHYAAARGAPEISWALLSAGARVDAASVAGATPLHFAAQAGNRVVVEWLLEAGAEPDAADANGNTPLFLAIHKGDKRDGWGVADVVRRLLAHGASPNPPEGGRSPLAEAVRLRFDGAAALLIDHGADAGLISCKICVLRLQGHGQYGILARIVPVERFGVDVPPSELESWLRGAIEADAPDKVRQLLEFGARIDDPSLYELMAMRDAGAVMADLLRHGDLHAADLRPEFLDTAALWDSAKVAGLLIEHGVNLGQRDGHVWSPLHWALVRWRPMASRPLNVARLLIEAGAPVDVSTAAVGWTPLHLAADLNEPEIIQMLLDAGANVNARTNLGGWTPLYVAEQNAEQAQAAASLLRAAGGSTTRSEDLADVPIFVLGKEEHRSASQTTGTIGEVEASYDSNHDSLYRPPSAPYLGGRVARGSFTAPGVEERLVLEKIGPTQGRNTVDLVALVDDRGQSRLQFAADGCHEFKRLCLNPETETHTAVFTRGVLGAHVYCVAVETLYLHYDADAGTLKEAYVDRWRPTTEEAHESLPQDSSFDDACDWPETKSAEKRYHELLQSLQVGGEQAANIGDSVYTWDGEPVSLPMRVIAAETVESSLAAIKALPFGQVSHDDLNGSPRWKVVTVSEGYGNDDEPGGSALLWDKMRAEWRSFYDAHYISVLGLDGNVLIAGGVSPDCRESARFSLCYFAIDLETLKVERIQWQRASRLESALATLPDAVRTGDVERVVALLESGVPVNERDGEALPLHIAAADANLELVELLVRAGADANQADQGTGGGTPLHWAVTSQREGVGAVVGALVEAGSKLYATDREGRTPLDRAVVPSPVASKKHYMEAVLALIEAGAELEPPAQSGLDTPLMLAMREDIDVLRMLVDAGADVNYRGGQPYSPLHLAVCEQNPAAVGMLLAAGAEVDAHDDDGRTPLDCVAQAPGDASGIAEMLIDAGADVDGVSPSGATVVAPLPAAVYAGNGRVAALLLARGAAVDETASLLALAEHRDLADVAVGIIERTAKMEGKLLQPDRPRTLLEAAVRSNARLAVPWLLQHRDERGPTDTALLRTAAVHDSAAVAEYLIDAGVSLAERDERGRTVLHAAVVSRSSDVAELLADRGADVNAADLFGWTPLHLSLFGELGELRPETVRLLLERGARVEAETLLAGWRPLHIAAHLGSPEVVELLLEQGADVKARMRLGERTPLHLALRRQAALKDNATSMLASGSALPAALDEVVSILTMAGAKDHQNVEAFPPVHYDTHVRIGQNWKAGFYPRPSSTALDADWRVINGSFSAAGAKERLFIGAVGRIEWGDFGVAYLHALLDRAGLVRMQWLADRRFEFVGLSPNDEGVDRPMYVAPSCVSPSTKVESTMRYDPRTHQFHSNRFENLEVEAAYHEHTKGVSMGIYMRFDSEDLPNQRESRLIIDAVNQLGLAQLEVTDYSEDMGAVYWNFHYPYWRFDEDVQPVCNQLPKELHEHWLECGSSTRLAWPANCG